MTAPRNSGHYRRRFVRWGERPGSSPAARFAAAEVVRQLRDVNDMFDEHEAQGVLAEATAACAAEARRQAAQAAGWEQGWPGE